MDDIKLKSEIKIELHDIMLVNNDESVRKQFSGTDISTSIIHDDTDIKIDIKHEPIDIDFPIEEITVQNNPSTVKQEDISTEESDPLQISQEVPYEKPSTSGRQSCIDKKKILLSKKKHNCSYCNKSFSRNSNLKVHERKHTGEKTFFPAVIAIKTFSRVSSKINHERIHTGEKPFSCSYCNKSFSRVTSKINHERIHTVKKPYTCRYCDKTFNWLHEKTNHERIHTGEKTLFLQFIAIKHSVCYLIK